MDNSFNPDVPPPPRPLEPETRAPSDLPEAHDKTTEQIHQLSKPKPNDKTAEQIHELSKPKEHDKTTEQIRSLSNFNVSEALGLPLLTKDIGKPTRREGTGTTASAQNGTRESFFNFGYYSAQDRLMGAAVCLIILGPLFLGAFRG